MRSYLLALLLSAAVMLPAVCSCAIAENTSPASAEAAPDPAEEVGQPGAGEADAAPPAEVAEPPEAGPAEEDAPDAPPAEPDPAEKAAAKRAEGIAEAMSGDFDQAVEALGEAIALLPEDAVAGAALELLNDYQAKLVRGEAERAQEYADTVTRVRRSMMVQSALGELADDETNQKLRETVDDLFDRYEAMPLAQQLEDASVEWAEITRTELLSASQGALAAAARLSELTASLDSRYGQAFGEVSAELARQLGAYRDEWQAADLSSLRAVASTARKLEGMEGELALAMTDVATMVTDESWRVALVQGALAKKLASPNDNITEQDWYIQLIGDSEARGLEFIKQAEWENALIIYGGLESIDKNNAEYKAMANRVGKHVRMLRYYGRADEEALPDSPPLWEGMVEGIDVDMVRTIISRVDSFYVVAIDYRKLIDEALTSIRVLAETPQAADSFASLADEALRGDFLEAINNTAEHFASKDGPLDYLDLLLALNRVLDASERTVKIPSGVLAMEFADGLLGGLDAFSSAIWPSHVEQFRKLTKGHFTGVGIQVAKEPGEPLRVMAPMAGTPAFRAGIKMGDLIVAVDGAETRTMTIDAVIDRIIGKKGTTVVLRIERKGVAKPFDVPIVRDKINILTIKGWRINAKGEWDFLIDADSKIGYIRVARFTEQTSGDLDKALKQLVQQDAESIILDFRLNPGGLLRQATRMANEFVPGGQIVMTQGRQVRRSRVNADWTGDFLRGDLIVLVDEYTASASEIVAGALADMDRAIVIGQRSFGKGSVQQVLNVSPPPNQALLKLTAAYYYVGPSEKLVHRKEGADEWGVSPDIEVQMTPGQMKRWLDIRQRTDLLHEVNADILEGDLAAQLDADLQLTTALTLLRLKHLTRSAEQTRTVTVPAAR